MFERKFYENVDEMWNKLYMFLSKRQILIFFTSLGSVSHQLDETQKIWINAQQ